MTDLSSFLATCPDAILIEIVEARGSTPRAEGTFMLVAQTAIWGTIGGGQFEYMAIDNARALLSGSGKASMDIPLGPEIGQCCGGRTRLAFTPVTADVAAGLARRLRQEDEARPAIFLFGCGHVGLALARALAPLPLAVTMIETRAEALAELDPFAELSTGRAGGMARRLTALPEALVDEIPAGGAAVILTHDHALDFLIAARALARPDLTYVGMIGSRTKRATFAHWLTRQDLSDGQLAHRAEDAEDVQNAGDMLSRLVLPVGGALVKDKRPAVIAALVAAELLQAYAAPRQARPAVTEPLAGCE